MTPALPSDIFKTGQLLNNTYQIMGLLGRGGTGEVYRAENQITGRISAIKALNARFSGNADYLGLMKREEQMRNIIHDAVVRYSECSKTDDGHVFLVMDFIDGVSLQDLMLDTGIDRQSLLIVAHRVLEGLRATHAQGIVHRDLSPDNIILRGGHPEQATIIDFGIAKDTAAGARTIVGNEFAGKYEYAAPEQLDGHADARSDLYGLGAALLAAHRRALPDIGTNPGDIVRSKKAPLDTSGIDGPLKDLIDWLCAPDPADRPQSAAHALETLDRWLKPDAAQAMPQRSKIPLVLGGAVVAALTAAWLGGAFDRFLTPLPRVTPYTLDATGSRLNGHAPTAETAAALAAIFSEATQSALPEGAITLASGVPSADWPAHVGDLLTLSGGLEDWHLSVSDQTAELSGVAVDAAARADLTETLRDWSELSGMAVTTDIAAGPVRLSAASVLPILTDAATCGPLTLAGESDSFLLGDSMTIMGEMVDDAAVAALRQTLTDRIGDRDLRLETTVLNDQLCAIRAALPPAPEGNLALQLGNADGSPNLTGVYRTGTFIVADILVPGTVTQGFLSVFLIDNSGNAFHLIPNVNRPDNRIEALGELQDGLRRIGLLGTPDGGSQSGFALSVEPTDHGKSEIVAILSSAPLIDLRPRDESVAALAEALNREVASRADVILGVSSRILDLRP